MSKDIEYLNNTIKTDLSGVHEVLLQHPENMVY